MSSWGLSDLDTGMVLASVNLFGSCGEPGSQKRSRISHFLLIPLHKLNSTEHYQVSKFKGSRGKLKHKDHKSRSLGHTPEQGFSIPALLTFGARSFSAVCGGRPVHCRMFCSIPGLYLLDASSRPISLPHLLLWQPTTPAVIANAPWEEKVIPGWELLL